MVLNSFVKINLLFRIMDPLKRKSSEPTPPFSKLTEAAQTDGAILSISIVEQLPVTEMHIAK